MKTQKKKYLIGGLKAFLGGVFLIILFLTLHHFEVIQFVSNGQQTIWGMLLFLLGWPSLGALTIGTFQFELDGSIPLASTAMVIGIFLNIIYFFIIGAISSFIFQKTKPF